MLAAITLAGQSAASAAPNVAARPDGAPGHWSQVTGVTTNIADVGLVRGTDGVLHILWEAGKVHGQESLKDTKVGGGGTVLGAATTIVGGQNFVGFPDATAAPNGLHVFWAGSTTTSSPTGIFEANRPSRGGNWTVGSFIKEGILASPLTAATAADGKPWLAYTSTDNLSLLHLGQPQQNVATKCCLDLPGLATDGASAGSYLTYFSLIRNVVGIWLHPLSKTGLAGKAVRLPGSATNGNAILPQQRTAITGRGKGRAGVYASYGAGFPIYRTLDVYRIGASRPFALASFGGSLQLAGSDISAGPDGRLWVSWFDGRGGPPAMFVRASNPAVSAWTTTARVALPAGTTTIWKLYENAQGKKVDVVALMTVHGHIAYFATQVPLPPPPKN